MRLRICKTSIPRRTLKLIPNGPNDQDLSIPENNELLAASPFEGLTQWKLSKLSNGHLKPPELSG